MIKSLRTKYVSANIGVALLRPLMGIGVFCALSAVVVPLHAENLPEPTRPPSGLMAGAGARQGRGATSSGLRSILISGNRRAAIIDGKTVELGGKLGNARLIEVSPGSVVLQRGKKRQVLTLFPRVRISHQEIADTGTSKMESSGNETQVEQPSPAEEKLLSVHPKEEK